MSDPHPEQSSRPGEPPVSASTAAEDARLLERAVYEVKKVVVGQDRLIEMILVGLLSRGHILLEGVPGVAKTLTVETFATVVGLTLGGITGRIITDLAEGRQPNQDIAAFDPGRAFS